MKRGGSTVPRASPRLLYSPDDSAQKGNRPSHFCPLCCRQFAAAKIGATMISIAWSVIAPLIRAVAALVIIVGAAYGQNLPWCAIMDNDGTTQCNYSTLQQCLQTLSGIGGRCIENPSGSAPPSLLAPPSSENAQGLQQLQLQNPGPPPPNN
jgi:hypothetical protein